jgi:hypothetical protein
MRTRSLSLLLPALVAAAFAGCGQVSAGDLSTAIPTTVLIKAQPTIDVKAHYSITLTCGAHTSLTGKGIAVAGAKAAPACAFLTRYPELFRTRHMCVTVDGGSAAVTETSVGHTVKSCIGGNLGTGAEGALLHRFQTLVFSRP